MVAIISRAGWGARPPKDAPTPLTSARGTKVHYTGGRVDPAIVEDHRICLELMQTFQRQHMDGNGWSDFAYNLAACPHRRLLMGRGLKVMSAANGPGLNTGHYAILALVGNSGFVEPTPELLHALRDGIDLLRKNGAGVEIRGHRDGYATACPGGLLYAWVRAGAPRPADDKPEVDADGVPVFRRMLVYRAAPDMVHGSDVKAWQARIAARGWDVDVDGWYGAQSAGVCEAFQRAAGLTPSGRVDRTTWRQTWLWQPAQPGVIDHTN
jgi:hypothetical protein